MPFKIALFSFAFSFIALGYLGMIAWGDSEKLIARLLTGVYFGYFIFIFFYSKNEKHKPIPERLTH
jgi:ubiquinol-cytochrome c reductase cytochrome b subunit